MSKLKEFLICSCLLLLAGCERGTYLHVRREWVDGSYLASTHVGTPDPRQAHPPFGQQLVVYWWVPQSILNRDPKLVFQVIYWNFTQATFSFPIKSLTGYEALALLDDDYREKQGFLTYRIQIVTSDGDVFKDWKHQLWVNLIEMEEKKSEIPKQSPLHREDPALPKLDQFDDALYGERTPVLEDSINLLVELENIIIQQEISESAERMSSSVEAQSKQGSVIETPYLSESSSNSD
jgi:hypothetical protein